MLLSKAKILELQQEYRQLSKSLDVEKQEGTQKGGPMDSFKEAAAVAVQMGAKIEKVDELRRTLADAQILADYVEGDKILLGKWFTLQNALGKKRYRLVDPVEANPAQMLISQLSPLGSMVMGLKAGDKFMLNGNSIQVLAVE